jgi:hypothetical protein
MSFKTQGGGGEEAGEACATRLFPGAGVALVVVWMRGALAARAVNIAASLLSLALAGGGSGGGGIDTALPRP